MSESSGEFHINTSSEQSGGDIGGDIVLFGFFSLSCLVCILSIIMICIINNGNHCKNRGGKKA